LNIFADDELSALKIGKEDLWVKYVATLLPVVKKVEMLRQKAYYLCVLKN